MKQLKKYFVGMLLVVALCAVTACGRSNNQTTPDNPNVNDGTDGTGTTTDDANGENNGPGIDDILFDTDGDGVYDHTDVDGDGLLEEIGRDTNDVVDDLVNYMTGDGMMVDGTVDNEGTVDDATDTTTNGTNKQ